MKKTIAMMLAVIATLACVMLTGCKEKPITYSVDTSDFFYSADKGVTYGNRRKEFSVGETIYMQVIVKVTSTSEMAEPITVRLTIPSITAIEAQYRDGQIITPSFDAVKNETTYDFTVTASIDEKEWNLYFLFKPNAEAEVSMTLEFDDHFDSMFDKQDTLKFVESVAGEE